MLTWWYYKDIKLHQLWTLQREQTNSFKHSNDPNSYKDHTLPKKLDPSWTITSLLTFRLQVTPWFPFCVPHRRAQWFNVPDDFHTTWDYYQVMSDYTEGTDEPLAFCWLTWVPGVLAWTSADLVSSGTAGLPPGALQLCPPQRSPLSGLHLETCRLSLCSREKQI